VDIMQEKTAGPREDYCFACGQENPIGLHLRFGFQDGRFVTKKTLPREYQSFAGIVHGGIVTTLLDEAMGGMLYESGEKAVTARLDVRYRHPTPIGEELTIMGWEEERRGRFVKMKATIALADGTVTAEGTAQMAVVE
jgi:acyl-coenzyme A thioesterase PaaI-like protein